MLDYQPIGWCCCCTSSTLVVNYDIDKLNNNAHQFDGRFFCSAQIRIAFSEAAFPLRQFENELGPSRQLEHRTRHPTAKSFLQTLEPGDRLACGQKHTVLNRRLSIPEFVSPIR